MGLVEQYLLNLGYTTLRAPYGLRSNDLLCDKQNLYKSQPSLYSVE